MNGIVGYDKYRYVFCLFAKVLIQRGNFVLEEHLRRAVFCAVPVYFLRVGILRAKGDDDIVGGLYGIFSGFIHSRHNFLEMRVFIRIVLYRLDSGACRFPAFMVS